MADFVHIDQSSFDEAEASDTLGTMPNKEPPEPATSKSDEEEEEAKFDLDLAFLDLHPFVRQTVLDRIYGCMIGSALGDTVGLYTEFLSKSQSEGLYKDRKFSLIEPVTKWYSDNHRDRFEPCAWTDDTDQALLILLAYLHSTTKAITIKLNDTTASDLSDPASESSTSTSTSNSTSTPPPPDPQSSPPTPSSIHSLTTLPQSFATRLRIWIEQGLLALNRPPLGIGGMISSVAGASNFLNDPLGTATRCWINSTRTNAPNGSLMRTHPVGLICLGMSEEEMWRVASEVGRTTHVDPRCTVAVCITVGLIRGVVRGEVVDESGVDAGIERAYDWVKSQPELMNPGLYPLSEWEVDGFLERKEFERHVYAKGYEELELDNGRERGYVYKCLGAAVWVLRMGLREMARAKQSCGGEMFERLMTDLVMQGGDADTNAAVAGALLGALVGYSNLPPHWSNGLAHKEWLMEKIRRLTIAVGVVDGQLNKVEDEEEYGGKVAMSRDELEKRDADLLHRLLLKDKERKENAERERNKGKGVGAWFRK